MFNPKTKQPCYDSCTLAIISPFQVLVMEILYVTTIVAIFGLCFALYSTTRRILHSSPLSSGDLSLTQPERLTQSWEPVAQPSFEETSLSFEKPEYAEESSNLTNPAFASVMAPDTRRTSQPWEPVTQPSFEETALSHKQPEPVEESLNIADFLLPEATAPKEVLTETVFAPAAQMPLPELPRYVRDIYMSETFKEPEIRVQPRAKREDRPAGSSPRTYHYILEYLLIGISVFVLVKTQRSVSEHRSLQSSNRVA